MKLNKVVTALMVSIMAVVGSVSYIPNSTQTVYAETIVTKVNATIKEFNISCNGVTKKVPAYIIDGRSYFRITDVAKLLNYHVATDGLHNEKLRMLPDTPFNGDWASYDFSKMKSITTNLFDIELSVGSAGFGNVNAINVDNRNYIKVADIANVVKANYDVWDKFYRQRATLPESEFATNELPVISYFTTDWDGATNTVKLNILKTDTKTYRTGSTTNDITTQKPIPSAPIATPTPKTLADTPPTVGSSPAKILKDPTKTTIYTDDGHFAKGALDNFTEIYRHGIIGQCTWYAEGRFLEVNDIDIDGNGFLGGTEVMVDNAEKFNKGILKVIRNADGIVGNSIAVWNGHVLYVEYVVRDIEGNPTDIYFTEANVKGNGKYRPDADGKIQKMKYSDFIMRGSAYYPKTQVLGVNKTLECQKKKK